MKAISYSHFGDSNVLQLRGFAIPAPDKQEVVVKLHYSAVNPSDVKLRAGQRSGVESMPYPEIIPHSDGAGIICEVGENISPSRIGERVWIWNGQWERPFGTAAEYICVPSSQAVFLPDEVSFAHGALLGIPGITAAHAVFSNGELSDKWLLICGGNGNVGRLALQLAVANGARVIASCSAKHQSEVLGLGATAALDYRSDTLARDILQATGGELIQHAIDSEFGENIDVLAEVMADNGYIATFGSAKQRTPTLPFYPLMFKSIKVHFFLMYLLTETQLNTAITGLMSTLSKTDIQFKIDSVFPLSRCREAHDRVEYPDRSGAVLLDITT